MSPKEKAEELVNKFYDINADNFESFNWKCALTLVNEILSLRVLRGGWPESAKLPNNDSMRPYWEEVKKEIEKA